MYEFNINDHKKGDQITDIFVLSSVNVGLTKTKKEFISLILSNKNGNYDAKIWDLTDEIKEKFTNGKVMIIKGKIEEFNGNKQVIIGKYKEPTENQYDISNLVKSSKYDKNEMLNYILDTVENMKDEQYKLITSRLLNKYINLYEKIGAASKNHHNFMHGLLEHNYGILKSAKFMYEMYSDNLNEDRLYCGAILHDIGKVIELDCNEQGVVQGYTNAGQLLGHLVIGAQEVAKTCMELRNEGYNISYDTEMLVSHMLISHHSEPEFGSVKRPALKEAELIYRLDSIDAFMQIFDNVCDTLQDNQLSDRQYNLGSRVIGKYK